MPLVSVTRLRIRSWVYFPAFFFDAYRTSRQAAAAEGNLATRILRDTRRTWWTCTAWDSELSMRKFMLANPHGPAMLRLRKWCDEASVTHWTQPDAILPSWKEAHRRMQREGRMSKVDRPSPNQAAKIITPPIVKAGSEIIFK